tara:strand:- start:2726 stop:3745 length:1020 start_codon:yes stop_codon:yes gene_type:complete
MNNLDDWLDQIEEEIIDPHQKIIDPHHHLWPGPSRTEGTSSAFRYLLEDFWKDTNNGHHIVKSVFVECGQGYLESKSKEYAPVGETEFVLEVSKQAKKKKNFTQIEGIVGHADMMLGSSVKEILEAHIDAGEGLFKGIRHGASWDESKEIRNSHSDPIRHIYLNDDFQKGVSELESLGLTLDAWNYHTQISELNKLAKLFPNLKIVQNHFGGPLGIGPYADKKNEVYESWKQDISELAENKNVFLKLGGLAMPINGWDWHKRDIPASSSELYEKHKDYYLHSINEFGAERCMFESNFPVDKRSISYKSLWNAFKLITHGFTQEKKDLLFYKTAESFYQL